MSLAQKAEAAGPVLSNIFGRAIRLGRRVRAETALGKLAGSIGSIAAEYAADRFGDLKGRHAVVIGSGEAARDAARALWKGGARLVVAGRSSESAGGLAAEFGGSAITLEELHDLLGETDVAVFAVGGGEMLDPSQLTDRRKNGDLLVLDLSVPPAVSSQAPPKWVEVRTLEDIPGPRGPEITDAVIDAEAIVKKEVADLQAWADTRASGSVIADLHTFAGEVVQAEVARAVSGWDLSPDQLDRLQILSRRIAAKLLHGPTAELRRSDEASRAMIRRIFHLDG